MENHPPLISVIVPIYNAESYLKECLDSLCNQTYQHIEIICVNDGSTDGSMDILQAYQQKDSRIKVINQSNQGLAEARNAALKTARGEWVTGVDADDYLSADTYKIISKHLNDDIDIACYDIEGFCDNKIVENNRWYSQYGGKQKVTEELIWKTNVYFCNKVWRTSFVNKHRVVFPKGLLYEDAYFYYTLAPKARHIYFVQDKLYHYRQRSGSLMYTLSPRGAEHIDIASLILKKFDTEGLPKLYGVTRPAPFECRLLTNYTKLALKHTPKEMHGEIRKRALRLAERYNMIKKFPDELHFLVQSRSFVRLFYRVKAYKRSYCFLGLPILTIKMKENTKHIRILGFEIISAVHKNR